MLAKLGQTRKKRETDAGWMGWQYRFLTGFGAGFMISFIEKAGSDKYIDSPLYFSGMALIFCITPILVGEFMLRRRLDEYFKQIETNAVALGGIAALVATIMSLIITKTWLAMPDPAILIAQITVAVFYAARMGYIIRFKMKNKAGCDDAE